MECDSLVQEVAQEVGVAEHSGGVAYTGLTVVACIAAAEVEHDRHRVVCIAGAVQADYSYGALVHIVPRTADTTGAGEHCTGEC